MTHRKKAWLHVFCKILPHQNIVWSYEKSNSSRCKYLVSYTYTLLSVSNLRFLSHSPVANVTMATSESWHFRSSQLPEECCTTSSETPRNAYLCLHKFVNGPEYDLGERVYKKIVNIFHQWKWDTTKSHLGGLRIWGFTQQMITNQFFKNI